MGLPRNFSISDGIKSLGFPSELHSLGIPRESFPRKLRNSEGNLPSDFPRIFEGLSGNGFEGNNPSEFPRFCNSEGFISLGTDFRGSDNQKNSSFNLTVKRGVAMMMQGTSFDKCYSLLHGHPFNIEALLVLGSAQSYYTWATYNIFIVVVLDLFVEYD
ncbi:hypothetical protein PHJA_001893500 [Phtheirospermum japonicum]|uniref:Uncharacterized protein n=1 Tax=Phtheirospermum japonicum TaxID=374723 RepID=A0A830CMP0_9LAMI|nr:hypothetical protein PHJA_001893500 [Phtheirospermum japonicum]